MNAARQLGRPVVSVLLVAAVAAVWVGVVAWLVDDPTRVGVDYVAAYHSAAHHVLDGVSPYPRPHDASLDAGSAYVYPPTLAVAIAPLALLPQSVAVGLWVAFLVAALALAIALCGVRDWRCFAAVALWAPAVSGIQTGNLSIVLALLAAAAWRFRASAASAAGIGLALALKLALAPLVAWRWSVRGTRAALVPVAIAGSAVVVSWAVIGFAGLHDYLSITRELTHIEAPEAYSLEGLGALVGLPAPWPRVLWLALAATLVVATVIAGRRGDDERSFVLAVFASLAVMPILWLHGFVLLAVPLAVVRPSFGVAWLLPLGMWFAPVTAGSSSDIARVLAITGVMLALCLSASPARRRHQLADGSPRVVRIAGLPEAEGPLS